MDEAEEEEVDEAEVELVDGEPHPLVAKVRYKCLGSARKKCSHEAEAPWLGRCPVCEGLGGWRKSGGSSKKIRTAKDLANRPLRKFIPTGLHELDLVLGGGFVRGSTILFGGPPGVGKSTLLIQACDGIVSDGKRTALYAGDEMNDDDIASIVQRVEVKSDRLRALGSTSDVDRVIEVAEEMDPVPTLIVVDSIQTAALDDVDAAEGSQTQVDACANRLTAWVKRKKVSLVLVCHVNTVGEFKGSKSLQHYVDALVFLEPDFEEDDSGDVCRLFVVGKNRNGSRKAEARLVMSDEGKLVSLERRSNIIKLPPRRPMT